MPSVISDLCPEPKRSSLTLVSDVVEQGWGGEKCIFYSRLHTDRATERIF